MNPVVFEGDTGARAPLLLPSRVASSPVAHALVRRGIVPSERAARAAVIAAAVLAVAGAFTSVYLTMPNRGRAGAEYASLSAAELAEIPVAERAYLEHAETLRRERAAEPDASTQRQ